MIELLERLCKLDATSGDEDVVRAFIRREIEGYCTCHVDAMGNIIAEKTGKNRAARRVMLDAHMDEVGLIISAVTPDGFLKFHTVGGMETAVLTARRVTVNGRCGVIAVKPVHLCDSEERKKLPKQDALVIDIGAKSRDEALDFVSPGDRAVLCSEWMETDEKICSKALDDRVGCAILIRLLQEESAFDFTATFSVQEEVGCRGAKAAAFAVAPDAAVILEGTTAADLADVPAERQVCVQGHGAAVSFMDGGTLYDRKFYDAALHSGILCQPKAAVTGGNNAMAVHQSRTGVRTVAVSVPCRYIHSATSVADKRDMDSALQLARFLKDGIAGGTVG